MSDTKSILKIWSDYIIEMIDAESELAAKTIRHSGEIGNVREFVIRSILNRILPSIYEISTGQIFDISGNYSNQIDIIIHRRDLPVIRHPDESVSVMIESVLATIEVKSTLSKEKLFEALNNCASVNLLQPNVVKESRNKIAEKYGAERTEDGSDYIVKNDALKNAQFHVHGLPHTYIYAYKGYKTKKGLREAVVDWCYEREKENQKLALGILPSFIRAEKASGFKNFDPFNYDAWFPNQENDTMPELRHSLMFFEDSKPSLSLFIFHLLYSLHRKIPAIKDFYGIQPNLEGHLKNYLQQFIPMVLDPLYKVLSKENGIEKRLIYTVTMEPQEE